MGRIHLSERFKAAAPLATIPSVRFGFFDEFKSAS
jgi:hypothetical protein